MSATPRPSLTAANAMAAALALLCNGGFVDVYATGLPPTPETAPGASPLATLQLPSTFAASIVAGVITANAIPGVLVLVSGTALWFRVTEADHATPVFDGTVGISGTDMVVNTTSAVAGASFNISSLTYSVPGT